MIISEAEVHNTQSSIPGDEYQLKVELRLAQSQKDNAYLERNYLVAVLSRLYPSGIRKTAIEGWDPEWHNCVYIDFPWGQASWHYPDSQAFLFEELPEYTKSYDGHTTEEKYEGIQMFLGVDQP